MVKENITAYITLDGVNIQFNDGSSLISEIADGTCAFDIAGATHVNLTLKGTNTLKSGYFLPGLKVEGEGKLTITEGSTGSLSATSENTYSIGPSKWGSNGTIIISGGTVVARLIGKSKSTNQFFTGSDGGAFIVAETIYDQSDKKNWSGVIFEGGYNKTGKVYGNPTLKSNAEISSNQTLTINEGQTLTINRGVTLTNNDTINNNGTIINNGSIINNGTITNNGSITGNAPSGNGTYNTHSKVAVTFAVKTNGTYGDSVTNVSYGDTIKITATANRSFIPAAPKGRSAAVSKVDFYLGSAIAANNLGEGNVDSNGVATLSDITLNDNKWTPSETPYTIIADFGGSSVTGGQLFASTGEAPLTVNKTATTINTPPTAADITYGAKLSTSGLTGGSASVAGAFSWTSGNSDTVPSVSDSNTTEYSVTFTPTDTNYATATTMVKITVNPASRTIPTPTKSSVTATSVTLNAVTPSAGDGTVKYGYSTTNTAPSSWQESATITGLSANTPYYFFAKVTGGANHFDATSTGTQITTSKATLTVDVVTASGTYGDFLSALAISGEVKNGSATVGGTWSFKQADAGTIRPTVGGTTIYTATFTPTSSAGSYESLTKNIKPTITAKVLTEDMISAITGTFTYDGTEKKPTLEVTVDSKALTKDTDYTLSYSNNTNAGTATVTVNGKGNYSGTQSKNFTINPKSITPTLSVTGVTKVYDGTTDVTGTIKPIISFTDAVSGKTPVVTATFAYESATVGTGKTIKATDITLTTTDEVNKNYTLSTTEATTSGAAITNAGQTVTREISYGNDPFTYGDAAVELASGTPTFSPSGTITYKSSDTNVISVNENSGKITFNKAGTATITATNAVANYDSKESKVEITVGKFKPTVSVTVEKKTATFLNRIGIGTHEDTFTLKATVTGVTGGKVPAGTVAFKNGANEISDAGAVKVQNGIATFDWVKPNAYESITITAVFTATADTNYTNADGKSAEFSVDKANQQTLKLTAPTGGLIYGDTGKSFSVSSGSGTGDVTYNVINGDCITVDDNGNITMLKVGKATVTATKAADVNYNEATSDAVEIEVKAATPTINWANASQTVNYTGSMAQITPPNVTLVNGETYTGTITYSYTPKSNIINMFNLFTSPTEELPTNAGEYTVTAHVAASGNYKQADSTEMTLTIEKIAPTRENLTFDLTAVTYNGEAKAVVVTAKEGLIGFGTKTTVKYGGSTTEPKVAGTYAVTVDINVGDNYKEITGLELGDYTINKATPTITWPTADSITYGTALSTAKLTGGSDNGTFAWKTGTDNPTVSNSGYDVVFTPTDSDNFDYSSVTGWNTTAETVTQKVAITVAPAALTVTANNHSITYGEAPAHNDVAYSEFVNSDTDTVVSGTPAYTYSYSQFGNVGNSYTITPSGLSAANYTITHADGTLTVNQKEVGLTWNDVNGRKYGDGKTVTATATDTVNSDAISVTVDGGDKTAVGNNYTATATGLTGEKAENYKLPTAKTTTYSIAKADTFALNGSAEMIQLQANYTVELALTTVTNYPTTPGGTPTFEVTSNSNNGLISATIDTDGKTLVLMANNTSNSTADTVTVAVSGMDNYEDSTITITVSYTAKTSVTITGVEADTNLVYSGEPQQGYTGTPTSDYKGEYEISYAGANGTSYTSSPTAPTNAGSYTVTFKVPDSNPTYSGSKDVNFTIGKKEVTVKPKDETVKKGEPMPSFSLIYDGLIDSETLTLSETPAFSSDANDTNTVGEYVITWSNKDSVTFTDDVANNYEITKQKTSQLTIAEKIFTVTIEGGDGATGAGNHASGSTVSINAVTKTDSTFTEWTGTVSFVDAKNPSTTFTMPEQDVTITAKWHSSSGGSTGGGGGGGGGSTQPDPNTPKEPTNGSTTIVGEPDRAGNVTVTIPDKNITEAINAAKQQAGQNAISVTVNIQITQTANSLTAILSKPALDTLISENVRELKIGSSLIIYSFNLDALTEIQKSVTGSLTIVGAKHDVKKLSKEAQTAIGSRPVFNLTMQSGSKTITQFGKGIASVWMPYTPTADENEGRLQAAYVDANGKVSLLTASSYSKNAKALLFSTDHFSVYGVAYKAPTPAFTDTTKHWAKDDIDFVAARGLLSGTGKTTFSPDTSMTRGMFVTALGRMAGVDTKKYSNTKFTDVKADAYYSPYVAWANVNNIVNGTTATTFSPDQSITRQEMAVMLVNYSKAIGYNLPSVHAQVTFTDSASIGTWAKDAVKQMQMAGILTGKSGNKFDPTATATRAEVSAMLRRYVELLVSTETAEGWSMNESGQWMYIQDGKRVTGKKTVDGKAYEFDQYGVTTALLPERKYGVHTVKKGESFWSIARKYKVSMFELTAVNGKTIFSIIYAGDELKIPQK